MPPARKGTPNARRSRGSGRRVPRTPKGESPLHDRMGESTNCYARAPPVENAPLPPIGTLRIRLTAS
jgi:hypothetical protein